jgi:hypothetical protein
MAEEATDVQDKPEVKADPIMDILTEGEQDTPEAGSSPAKPAKADDKKPEAEDKDGDLSETPKPPEVPTKETEDGKEADDTAETADDETETQPQGKAEDRKQQLNTEIRDLVAQRNALKTEVEKVNSEAYQPATVDELVAQGMSATDARVEALDQRLQVQDYNNKVADAQLTIESESQRVLNDFPMFNPESSSYRKDIAEEAASLMSDAIIRDENTGAIIGSNISPYRLYKTLAASHNVSAQEGQLKGQQDTEKMLARADDTSSSAPKTTKKDPILAILEDVDGY